MGAPERTVLTHHEPLAIRTSDGFVLRARLYRSPASRSEGTVALINAGAGLRQTYYGAFASYLASAGISTLTYDYRGIGASRPASLRRFEATVEDWGSKDCASVVNWMKAQFPQGELAVIGHSVGALVTGFVTNGRAIDKLLWIGGHTGYFGDYKESLKPFMYMAWHVLMPAITTTLGYFPGRALGLGEDLPKGAALQWAQRRRPELWWNVTNAQGAPDERRIAELRGRFESIHARALAMRFDDDAFATEAATARMCSLFSNALVEVQNIAPGEAQLRRGGHFAFFRPGAASTLWPRALSFLTSAERVINP